MTAVIATIPVGKKPGAVAVHGTHAYVTNSDDRTVSVINTNTNTVTTVIPVAGGPHFTSLGSIAVSPDGSHAYVTDTYMSSGGGALEAGAVSVIETSTNTVTATIPVGLVIGDGAVAVNSDGTLAYVATMDGSLSVIDTTTNAVTTTVPVAAGALGVAISPGDTHVYVTNFNDGTVSVIDAATNTLIATVDVGVGANSGGGRGPAGVAVRPDGTRVYVANLGDDTLRVIDTATNTVTANILVGHAPSVVAVSPDGTQAYVTIFDDDSVSVIDLDTDTVTAAVAVGSSPGGVAVSPDGTRIYVTNWGDDTVSVIATDPPVLNSHLKDLIGRLIGAVDRDGGGWLVIGNHVIPIPPRSPFLSVIAQAAAPHVAGQATEDPELAAQVRQLLHPRSQST